MQIFAVNSLRMAHPVRGLSKRRAPVSDGTPAASAEKSAIAVGFHLRVCAAPAEANEGSNARGPCQTEKYGLKAPLCRRLLN